MFGILKKDDGFAMFFVLMIGVLIAVVGGAALITSSNELGIAGSMRRRGQAYYMAEAGVWKSLDYINRTKSYKDTLYWNVTFENGKYSVLCQDSTKNPILINQQLYLFATGTINPAIRRLQVLLRKKEFKPSDIPGPLYIEAPTPQFAGNTFTIQGADHNKGAYGPANYIIGGDHRPAVTTIHSAASLLSALGSRADQTTSADSSGLFNPSYRASSDTIDLAGLAAGFAGPNGEVADLVGSLGGTYPNDYKVCYYGTDLHVSGQAIGAGVLIVKGDLKISGQFEWTGIVIVLGEVEVESNTSVVGGGQGVHVWGTLLSRTIDFKISGQADLVWVSDAVKKTIPTYQKRAEYTIGSIVEY